METRGMARLMDVMNDHQTDEDAQERLKVHHRQTLWVYWTLVVLGLWLLVAPFSLGYLTESNWVRPSGGRGVWWSDSTHDALRAHLMTGSDLMSGTLLIIFGTRTLRPNRPVSLWICCVVGMWLVMAPVFFWAPTATAFHNGSIVGILTIALSILIPGMPNMMNFMQHGPGRPPGWSYNPSTWAQRWILIATGLAGFLVSRHLAMFQLGYIDQIWEPFFEEGSVQVLNSEMSHSWPISDAGLGTISYTFEFLMGYMGSPKRWRTMPWMVAFFGVLVVPLGLTHILLVLSQPVVVGSWCTLCLLAAGIMLPMIPLEVDEVVAMAQHLMQAKRRGDRDGSLWEVFWKGGKADGCEEDERSLALVDMSERPLAVFKSMVWGVSVPWTLACASLIGVWLTLQPAFLGSPRDATGPGLLHFGATDIFHLVGALVVVTSVISMGEVLRAGRFLNVPLALLVAIAPWCFPSSTILGSGLGTCSGIAILLLSFPRGVVKERYGKWQRWIF